VTTGAMINTVKGSSAGLSKHFDSAVDMAIQSKAGHY